MTLHISIGPPTSGIWLWTDRWSFKLVRRPLVFSERYRINCKVGRLPFGWIIVIGEASHA